MLGGFNGRLLSKAVHYTWLRVQHRRQMNEKIARSIYQNSDSYSGLCNLFLLFASHNQLSKQVSYHLRGNSKKLVSP